MMEVSTLHQTRVAILLPDLRPGGAERVCINLANEFVRRGFAVDLVLMQRQGELLPLVNPAVSIVDLASPRVRYAVRPLAGYLKKRKPTALLANMWPLTVIAIAVSRLAGPRIRVVVVEHNYWSVFIRAHKFLHRVAIRLSMRFLMPWADARVGVSAGVATDLELLARLRTGTVHAVFNPVTGLKAQTSTGPEMSTAQAWVNSFGKKVIAIGTLKSQKRFDRLLHAFARLPDRDTVLMILGEGGERKNLETLAQTLSIADRVFMPGFTRNPAYYLHRADLFVLSSDYEGLPTVMVEALEQGTPVVSTDCPSGPREILEDGKYGTLVPVGDIAALARAMEDALNREHDREALRRRAQDFSVDKAADAYLDLLMPGWREMKIDLPLARAEQNAVYTTGTFNDRKEAE